MKSEELVTAGRLNVNVTVKALDVFHQAGYPRPYPHTLEMRILSLMLVSGVILRTA